MLPVGAGLHRGADVRQSEVSADAGAGAPAGAGSGIRRKCLQLLRVLRRIGRAAGTQTGGQGEIPHLQHGKRFHDYPGKPPRGEPHRGNDGQSADDVRPIRQAGLGSGIHAENQAKQADDDQRSLVRRSPQDRPVRAGRERQSSAPVDDGLDGRLLAQVRRLGADVGAEQRHGCRQLLPGGGVYEGQRRSRSATLHLHRQRQGLQKPSVRGRNAGGNRSGLPERRIFRKGRLASDAGRGRTPRAAVSRVVEGRGTRLWHTGRFCPRISRLVRRFAGGKTRR